MVGFFEGRRQREILAACDTEFGRAAGMSPEFVSPRDVREGAALLQRAAAAGLSEHETVRRLAFLHRVWAALGDEVDATTHDELLAEAARYELADISAVRRLRGQRELARLREHGPRVETRDSQDRGVYFRCEAEFKNRPGRLDIREDGLTFTGEVVVDVAWSNVAHAARTTHAYQGYEQPALAVQEGKRRTPTKFTFGVADADYACEVALTLWQRSRK